MEGEKEKAVGTKTREACVSTFNLLMNMALANATAKGFYKDGVECNDAEQLALIHSEVSEALEYLRHGNPPDDKIPSFTGLEAELADIVIRVLSYSGKKGVRLGDAIMAKMEHNSGRPSMHGGKLF